ncbi:MAG: hypothetical protein K9H26_13415, partial [Prolixibacteraceae bacterium]|nr:hypothetical protein [Prolixibacteraceae bacterium]
WARIFEPFRLNSTVHSTNDKQKPGCPKSPERANQYSPPKNRGRHGKALGKETRADKPFDPLR